MMEVCKSHNASFAERHLAMDICSHPTLKNSCRVFTVRLLKTQKLYLQSSEYGFEIVDMRP
jgi:hypothetical protein